MLTYIFRIKIQYSEAKYLNQAETSVVKAVLTTSLKRTIIMSKKQAYEKKLQAQLDEWSAQIDRLKAKADGKAADEQLEYYQRIEELESMKQSANKKLNELKKASDDAWEDVKVGIDSAWDSLSAAFKSASSRFK